MTELYTASTCKADKEAHKVMRCYSLVEMNHVVCIFESILPCNMIKIENIWYFLNHSGRQLEFILSINK